MQERIYKMDNGKEVPAFYFQNYMSHEDWHEAERLGLIFVVYFHHGPDYWDDELLFVRADVAEAVKEDYNKTRW